MATTRTIRCGETAFSSTAARPRPFPPRSLSRRKLRDRATRSSTGRAAAPPATRTRRPGASQPRSLGDRRASRDRRAMARPRPPDAWPRLERQACRTLPPAFPWARQTTMVSANGRASIWSKMTFRTKTISILYPIRQRVCSRRPARSSAPSGLPASRRRDRGRARPAARWRASARRGMRGG